MLFTDKIIVIDLEATCWEDKRIPNGAHIDIIEIGICNLVVQTGEIENKQSIYVIPERSEITSFCTTLTGITSGLIQQQGISFREACEKIVAEYEPKGRVWASFGEFDRSQFERQCSDLNVTYPLSKTHLNIKSLLALKMKFKNAKGLTKALKIIKEEFEGSHHCGADDAYNAAKILRHCLK